MAASKFNNGDNNGAIRAKLNANADLIDQAASAAASAGSVAAGKQAPLVSGSNIKTINGTSLLGSGDITVTGGGSSSDVIPVANLAALPGPGETGKIYITTDNNKQYRWGGSSYIELIASPGSTDNVPEGATNKYWSLSRTLGSVLSSFVAGTTHVAITASDTVITAFQKIAGSIATKFDKSDIDTDATLAGNSDSKVASQKAVKTLFATTTTGLHPDEFEIVGGQVQIKMSWFNAAVAAAAGTPTLAKSTVTFGTSTSTQNVANWSAVTNATSYVVKRSVNSDMSSSTTIYTGALLTFTDTGLTASTTYYYTVTASATSYTSSLSDTASKATGAASSVTTKFVDSGLVSGTSTFNSQVFEPDNAYVTTAGGSSNYTDSATITNTSYQAFYKSVRYNTNQFIETITGLANGNYTLHLHYVGYTNGHNFNVVVNGVTAYTNLDVAAEAGATNKALIKSYNVTVSGGQIVLTHSPNTGAVALAGFELVAQGTASKLA